MACLQLVATNIPMLQPMIMGSKLVKVAHEASVTPHKPNPRCKMISLALIHPVSASNFPKTKIHMALQRPAVMAPYIPSSQLPFSTRNFTQLQINHTTSTRTPSNRTPHKIPCMASSKLSWIILLRQEVAKITISWEHTQTLR